MLKMPSRSFCPGDSSGKFFLRLTLAVVMFPHGCQKMLGWFGGLGFNGTLSWFTDVWGIWMPFALIAMLIEFFAPILLFFGLLTRFMAFLLTILMLVAMQYHLEYGLFMNWSGHQLGEGVEFNLLYAGCAFALMLLGAGKFSLDRLLFRTNDCVCEGMDENDED